MFSLVTSLPKDLFYFCNQIFWNHYLEGRKMQPLLFNYFKLIFGSFAEQSSINIYKEKVQLILMHAIFCQNRSHIYIVFKENQFNRKCNVWTLHLQQLLLHWQNTKQLGKKTANSEQNVFTCFECLESWIHHCLVCIWQNCTACRHYWYEAAHFCCQW